MGSARRAFVITLGIMLATAGLSSVAPPASAASGTISVSGTTIEIGTSDAAEWVIVGGNQPAYCGTSPYCVFVQIPDGTLTTATSGCTSNSPTTATCILTGPATVFIDMGAGDDMYIADSTFPGLGSFAGITVDGGEDNDQLLGGGAPETLNGGIGDDTIYPDQGPSTSNVGPDTLIGGPGRDDVSFEASAGKASGVRLTLNGLADDGTSLPRDIDNVGNDFERHVLTPGPDVAIGNAESATFDGLEGDDRIDAGAGNDLIIGHAGNDTLDGGPGTDTIWGDSHRDATLSGNDTIVSTDGEVDEIHCGPGTDAVTADSIDKILDACESVTTGGGTTLSAEVAVAKPRLNANKRRKKATLALQCTGGLPCAGTVVVRTTKGKSRRIAGNKKLALGTFTLAANTKKTVKLKLRRPARKILKQTRRAGVRARLTLTNERVTTFTNLKITR